MWRKEISDSASSPRVRSSPKGLASWPALTEPKVNFREARTGLQRPAILTGGACRRPHGAARRPGSPKW